MIQWFPRTPTFDTVPDPFILDYMPNHLSCYGDAVPIDVPEDTAVIPASKVISPGVLQVPGPYKGTTFHYGLTGQSEGYAKALCSYRIDPRELPRKSFQAFCSAGLLQRAGVGNGIEVTADQRHRARDRGYAYIPGLIRPGVIGALRAHYRRLIRSGRMNLGDSQSGRRWVCHNEAAARVVQAHLVKLVSEVVEVPVKPTYTYSAIYTQGARLPPHRDREQCEYSITVPFEMSPEPSWECHWPLELQRVGEKPTRVYQRLGDGLLYRGRTLTHARDPLPAHVVFGVLLLHYVDEQFSGRCD
jgi:hypothetical protein